MTVCLFDSMKKCISCKIDKPRANYYAHSEMSDGTLNKCKDCCREQAKKRHFILSQNLEYIKKERDRHREKYHRLGYKDKHKCVGEKKASIMHAYNERYPEKASARAACQKIKCAGFEKHHWSYNKDHYKDVIFLRPSDHAKAHRFLKYDQSAKMYRNDDGVLLDSKMKHLNHLVREAEIKDFVIYSNQ